MRLLHAKHLDFHEFEGSRIPKYAILSHRWEEGEVTYQDMLSPLGRLSDKAGLTKVRRCCFQAVRDKYDYVWIDTCCIDKTSSAELSEAINSMFQWYKNSAMCYVYLSDVQLKSTYKTSDAIHDASVAMQIHQSKWWTRGWTLQELIAPRDIMFFGSGSHGWLGLGDKTALLDLIVERSGVHEEVLLGVDVQRFSIATRMSWASDRETTRPEDLAYCLLGIFGVNMALLYGEGERAFLRLQEEIMKQSDDQTLFAWVLKPDDTNADVCGPLATSPSMFHDCSELLPTPDFDTPIPYSMTNKGLRIELPVIKRGEQRRGIAVLQCSTTAAFPRGVALPIIQVDQEDNGHFARDGRYTYSLRPVRLEELEYSIKRTIFMKQNLTSSGTWLPSVFQVHQSGNLQRYFGFYQQLDSGSETVATRTEIEDRNTQGFIIDPGNYKGAIIYGSSEPDVLVLFNIATQRRGRYSCKVLYIRSRSCRGGNMLSDASPRYWHIQELLSGIKDYAIKYNDPNQLSKNHFMFNIEQRLNHLHDYYTNGSHSQTSFTYLEQEQDMAVWADIAIAPQVGQRILVLNIGMLDLSRLSWSVQELESVGGETYEETGTRKMRKRHERMTRCL